MNNRMNIRESFHWISQHAYRLVTADRLMTFLLALVALLVLGFAFLTEEIFEGDTKGFDEAVLLALRSPGDLTKPFGPDWLAEMVRDFTALGSTAVLTIIVIGVSGFLLLSGKRKTAFYVVAAVISGVIAERLLKLGFHRDRPTLVPHGVLVTSFSFPSGHSLNSTVVYLTLGNLLAQTQRTLLQKIFLIGFAMALATIVGVSRVYLGVHWPTDVLAGWVLGSSWALLCAFVMLGLQRRGKVESES